MSTPSASSLAAAVEAVVASTGFSGVIRVDREGSVELDAAFGLADRRHGVPMTTTTRLGLASGNKSLTAVTVMGLVGEGVLSLDSRVRDVLGSDLPMVDDRVTVEHLLAHRSGIGDYVDEEAFPEVTDHVLTVPVHTLTTTEDNLAVLDGRPQVFEPGAVFAYNNSAFVVLAVVAGRAAGRPFEDLLDERVLRPAGMAATAFLRSDELPADAATGYLWADRDRTNVLHLPVVGSGDGGLYSTSADIASFWRSLEAGTLLPDDVVDDVLAPRSTAPDGSRYGLGFWIGARDGLAAMVGSDAGVSFKSVRDRPRDLTWTVISNTSEGAWPVERAIAAHLAP
ncbi:MAG TPA: serine hydrolase domain-containing protein [Ornithinibacter sp.]|nr:serine hydrolase domain-containing protein [Ornithinibacter sp.]